MKRLPKGCLIALLVCAVLVVLLGVAGFLLRPKIVALAQEHVDQFLRKEGLFLDYELHTGRLDGVITLRNIIAYQTAAKQKKAASLDHLTIRVPLRSLLQDYILRTRLSTRNATFTVYGDEQTGNPTFENLHLSFEGREGIVEIEHLRTMFQGIEVRAAGDVRLDRPEAASTPSPRSSTAPVEPATPLDFTAILQLAPSLNYRQADWKPRLEIALSGTHSSEKDSHWEIVANSTAFPSKGVDLEFNGKIITGKDGNLVIEKAQLVEKSGEATIRGAILPDSEVLEINHFDSTLDWFTILRDHPAAQGAWDPLTVSLPPHLTGSGNFHLEDPNLSSLTFTLDGFSFRYQLENGKSPVVEKFKSGGSLEKGLLRLRPLSASVAKGTAEGELTYSPFAEVPSWGANLKGSRLYLPEFTVSPDGNSLVGYVDFTFAGSGAEKPADLQGQGRVDITNGDFFHTRVFGPLLLFLHRMSNNPEKGKPQELHASFVIRNGILRTEDLLLDISEARVQATGTIDLVKETARFEAQAKLRGPLGATVNLIGEGPLDNVEWRKK